MEKRIGWVDLASGIMIVWLLFFHALYPSLGANITGKIPVLYFFMPWFFFKSGMLFKIKEPKLEFRGNFDKLILKGFIKWSVIGYIVHILEHWLIFNDLTTRVAFYSPTRSLFLAGRLPVNAALWFLPVLFLIRQVFNSMQQKCAKSTWIYIGIGFIIYIICYFSHTRFVPTYINDFGWGLCCFSAGYWYSNDCHKKKYLISFSILAYLISLFTTIPDKYCSSQSLLITALWIPASILSCVAFNYLCQFIENVKCSITALRSFFKFIGKNSMVFYVSHNIINNIVFNIIGTYKESWYSTWIGLTISIICCLTIGICLVRFKQYNQMVVSVKQHNANNQ